MKRVRQVEYTGTIESYNEMVDKCGLSRDNFQIDNMDPKDGLTNKWTGHVHILQFEGERHSLGNVYLKPGDYYHYDIGDDDES
jgi:hypothetical protein